MAGQSALEAYLKLLRSRWIRHVCTTALGHTSPIASGRPLSPSQTTMHTSPTPRFLSSVSTRSQYLAPSPVGDHGIPPGCDHAIPPGAGPCRTLLGVRGGLGDGASGALVGPVAGAVDEDLV